MMQPLLSVVVPCMGRLHHLKLSMPTLLAQPEIEYILVDYSCPDRCGDYARAHWPRARVVEVRGETHFNLSRARNAGLRAASCPYLAILDADNIVSLDFAREVVRVLAADAGLILRQFMSGLLICRRAHLDRVGAYRETFQGWGVEDDEIFHRLLLAGIRQVRLPPGLLGVLEHPDADRVRHYGEKNIRQSSHRNGALLSFRIGQEARRVWPDPVTFRLIGRSFGSVWRSVQYACYVARLHRVRVRLYSGWHETMTPCLHGRRIWDGAGLLHEIVDALDAFDLPEIVEAAAVKELMEPAAGGELNGPITPTRTRWRGWSTGPHRRLAYQCADRPWRGAQSLSLSDGVRRFAEENGAEIVRLDEQLGVRACIEAAHACDLFVGGGLAHLCSAVGMPVFAVEDDEDPDVPLSQRVALPGIECGTVLEFLCKARWFLGWKGAAGRR